MCKIDAPHCIVATIAQMLTKPQSASVITRLKALNNMETFSYCLAAARSRTLAGHIYASIYEKRRDFRYYLILMLQRAPASVQPLLGKLLQRWTAFPTFSVLTKWSPRCRRPCDQQI